jgi:hypothetical protein
MGQNSRTAESPQTQNQSNAMLDDPRDGRRLTDNPKNDGQTLAIKAPNHDVQNQATIEEFGEEGMGVAPKE